jgi:chromosomal replication initiation ATPase DnaA
LQMNIYTDLQGIHAPPRRGRTATERRHAELCEAVVEQALCTALDVSPQQLRHPCRGSATVATARLIVMYVLIIGAGTSAASAAHRFGRHRSTGLYALRTIEERRDLDATFDEHVEGLVGRATSALAPLTSAPKPTRLHA